MVLYRNSTAKVDTYLELFVPARQPFKLVILGQASPTQSRPTALRLGTAVLQWQALTAGAASTLVGGALRLARPAK